VALSLGLPPLAINQHRAFHGVRTFLEELPPRDHPTTRANMQLCGKGALVNGESIGKIGDHRHICFIERTNPIRAEPSAKTVKQQ